MGYDKFHLNAERAVDGEAGPGFSPRLSYEEACHFGPSTLRFKRLRPAAKLPTYAHDGDSGMDGTMVGWHWPGDSNVHEGELIIGAGSVAIAVLGLAVALPVGTELQVRPRSGNSSRALWCALGTVDAGYRGELGATLCNVGVVPLRIKPGERICQLVLAPVLRAAPVFVDELDDTERGGRGFGSSGR